MADRILVVEDEPDILEVVRYNLEQAGFQVSASDNGEAALERIEDNPPELVILDLMLPGVDGLEVCRAIKWQEATKDLPVLILTAKTDEVDRIVGLELGADDYVVKPFSPRELVLRVKAILRRTKGPGDAGIAEEPKVLRAGPIEIDAVEFRAFLEGEPLQLTTTEFKLLHALVERRGRVQSREVLLSNVWNYEHSGYARTVDTHIRRLRQKLGESGNLVETVRGVGYRFRRD